MVNTIHEYLVIMDFKKVEKIQDVPDSLTGLYKIVFSDTIHYVGRSTDVRKRLSGHRGMFTKGKHYNKNFNEAYAKFGEPEYLFYETSNDNVDEAKTLLTEDPAINIAKPVSRDYVKRKSKLKGVSWCVAGHHWVARYKNKRIKGRFETEESAHKAYLEAKQNDIRGD